jgi:signal transduction histidine kinase
MDELLVQQGHWEGELTHTRRDGGRVVVDSRHVLVPDEEGRPAAILETNRDVTGRKETESARDVFFSMLTHDLRNPLAVIRGQTQLARRQVSRLENLGTSALFDRLGYIDEAVSQIDTMLGQLLDMARQESGQALDLHWQPTDLVALARQAVDVEQRTTTSHQVRLETSLPALVGNWDAERLGRVLSNLIGNAIKYSPEGGSVIVTVTSGAEPVSWAEVAVRDSGVGIPAADLPHIFDRFFRGTNVLGRIRGFGLGLAWAKHLVEQHGGTIAATSEEGIGSIFTIRLPVEVRSLRSSGADVASESAH